MKFLHHTSHHDRTISDYNNQLKTTKIARATLLVHHHVSESLEEFMRHIPLKFNEKFGFE